MSFEERNAIVPQMRDYDRLGERWLPYLMRTVKPRQVLPAVSTDEHGFRRTTLRDGVSYLTYEDFFKTASGGSRGIVLGSSLVFGVGASHDRYTVPSVLNRLTGARWFNFGGRAFNSTQETLLLLLHFPVPVERLVIMSGLNNLMLVHLAARTSPVFGAFFSQSVFEWAMAASPEEGAGLRATAAWTIRQLRRRVMPSQPSPVESDRRYADLAECLRRDLTLLARLTAACGIRTAFALQPVASWIDKRWSPEEGRLFAALDRLGSNWRVLAETIRSQQSRYTLELRHLCEELEIAFFDLNACDEFRREEWLFVDRVHLTDRGYLIAAQILKEAFDL